MSDTVVVPNNDPAAIESGNSWNGLDTAGAPVIVTFSFPTSLPAYDETIGGFTPATIASFTAFTAAEQAQALAALGQWAAASGIVFIEVPPGEGDITFANVSFSTTTTGSENGDYQGAAGIGFYPFGDWSYLTGNASSGYGFTSDLESSRRRVHELGLPQQRHGRSRHPAARNRPCHRHEAPRPGRLYR